MKEGRVPVSVKVTTYDKLTVLKRSRGITYDALLNELISK